ncbi:MAG: YIP1 family protein, partial [Woeseia sp.]
LLTGPLIVASSASAYALALVFSNSAMLGMFSPTLFSTLAGMLASAVAVGVVAIIFSALAGVFGGRSSFALGLAAVSLAFIPGYVGQALVWLPWVGGLLAFGLGIYSLVLLWKIIPLYLEVPDAKRAAHYIVALIATIVAMAIIGSLVGPMIGAPGAMR